VSGDLDRDQQAAQRRIAIAFTVTVIAAVAFAAAYTRGGHTQLMGLALGVAFAGLGYGLATWARYLLPSGGFVETRDPFASPPRERELVIKSVTGPESPLRRRGLVRLLGLAVGTVGITLLVPLRSLLPVARLDPRRRLAQTAWQAGGVRLVTGEGAPVRAADVTADTVLTVFPEGHTRAGDVPAFVVRLDPARFTVPPPGGDIGGLVAYSLLCTHAGCPVGLYERGSARMFCPCHQSVFDLNAGARPISGPAARPLPGLPIEVDAAGYLRARGDFTAPPGPGFWSRK
jgi:ubiquinol-cytochrome c reductase iron-sulfur subunit